MEIQHVCVPMTEYLWQRICGPLARDFAQAPVLGLICQCLVWMIIFYLFHRLQLFFQSRERIARYQKLANDHKILEDAERNAIEQLCLKFQAGGADDSGGAAQESLPPIPVSIRVDDDSCGVDASRDLAADSRLLLDAASQLRAPGQEVTVLQTCAGPIVQTELIGPLPGLCAVDALTTSTTSTTSPQAAAKKRNSFLVQLGRWRIFRPSTGGEEARMLKLDDTNPVPVILHSSYAGGKLTVEGLHLRQATIHVATKNKCIKLDTKYNSATKYVMNDMSDLKGLNCLEGFTFESGLPSKNLAEVCVIASKKMDLDEFKFSVNSSAVQIQNDNLRTVLRSIFPFTILAIYATKQILSSMMRIMETTDTPSVVAWLLPCIIISTQALPLRIETVITETLKKMALRAYHTLYFASQCFIYDEDQEILSMHEEVSRSGNQSMLKYAESSSFQSGMSAPASPSDSSKDSKDLSQMNEDDMKAEAHSSTVDNHLWEWPVYDSVFNKSTWKYDLVKRVQSKGTTDQMVPFEVIHLNLKDLPWASQLEVCILSPILMEIINVLIPGKLGHSARCKKKLSLNRPELFQIREGLRNEQAKAEQEVSVASSSSDSSTINKEKLLHLQHLLRFMDEEFEEIGQKYVAMKSEKRCLSWEMLWTLFPTGERVVYFDKDMDEKLCGDVLEAHYKSEQREPLFFEIKITKWDYNCRTWKQYCRKLSVPLFDGEREIDSLNVYPIQFEEDPKACINHLLDHGSRFCELSMMQCSCFKNYKGSMVRYKANEILSGFPDVIEKENADGRVMIDLRSFAKMNPSYPQLGTAKPRFDFTHDNKFTSIDIKGSEDRMFVPAMVYGFSFRLKQWGSFSVRGFSDINFNTSAFDDLVMDEDTKDVIEKLVQRKLEDGKDTDVQEREQLDSIACKGESLVFLCYGPPGTGKTLTAESLSEKLECPLWSLSVSELGITPDVLEARLIKVFDVAASWGAILLLDEADVFLEKRTASDLTRNAMTGVFLRLLEYYKGVIFLTTNRDSAFDDAITSRIAMKVRYDRLNEDQRRIIWTNMLARGGLDDISEANLKAFAEPAFNGREIRNIVSTAHILSRSEDNRADMEIKHVQKAFKVYVDSCNVWTTTPQL